MKSFKVLSVATAVMLAFTAKANATWQEGVAAFEAKNYAKAWEEFRPLENTEDSKYFLYYMGRMAQLGLGTEKNITKALEYYYKSAQQNDSRSAVEIGSIYFSGKDFTPDYPLAKQWFQYAASKGNPVAAYNLGVMYENGVGEPADIGKAFENYRISADKGYSEAQKKVGLMMYEGYGTPQDYTTAVKYLIKAADQGDTEAMMALGTGLSDTNRIGAPLNLMHAHKWFNIAAGYGTPEVRAQAVAKRDELTAKMKPEEVLAAHKLARKWHMEKTELNLAPDSPEVKKPAQVKKLKEEPKEEKTYYVPDILDDDDEMSLMPAVMPAF